MSKPNPKKRLRDHPLYGIWGSMNQRCHQPSHPAYSDYGGRGIHVCPEWRFKKYGGIGSSADSFRRFAAYMDGTVGPKPDPKFTMDRADNDRGYEPGNVRWATRKTQIANQRPRTPRVFLTIGGVTKSLAEWSAESGLPPSTIFHRRRRGYPDEFLLSPVKMVKLRYRLKRSA